MKKKSCLTIFLWLLLVLSLMACQERQRKNNQPPLVRVTKVLSSRGASSSTFPGRVIAAEDITLSFRVSGTICQMPAQPGTFVRKGTLLAEIDPRDYQLQFAATEAEYHQIKYEAERVIHLYQQQSVTQSDYDKAVYGLQQIQAKYAAHRNALADTRLCAPFDGYVQETFFAANETVGQGMPVLSMIGTRLPEVEINVPASEYIRRHDFISFSGTVSSYPNESYPLEVIGISQKANLNQLYTIRLRIKNGDKQKELPTAGMPIAVTIHYAEREVKGGYIPLSAIFQHNGKTNVWLVDTSTLCVAMREVEIEQIDKSGMVLITKGLPDNALVVSAGVHTLFEGETIRFLPEVSSTNVGGLL